MTEKSKKLEALGGVSPTTIDNMSAFFKVIADKTRLSILAELLEGSL